MMISVEYIKVVSGIDMSVVIKRVNKLILDGWLVFDDSVVIDAKSPYKIKYSLALLRDRLEEIEDDN